MMYATFSGVDKIAELMGVGIFWENAFPCMYVWMACAKKQDALQSQGTKPGSAN